MKLIDARKLTQEAQENLRLRVVKAVMDDGRNCTETAKFLGAARGTVSKWFSSYYKKGGEPCLLKKKRGRDVHKICVPLNLINVSQSSISSMTDVLIS